MVRSALLLAVTLVLVAALVAIAARLYRRPKEEAERAKHRMLEDD